MSLWLSRKLVNAVQQELLNCPEGMAATADLPRLTKALQDMGVEVEPLHEATTGPLRALIVEGVGRHGQWSAELEGWRPLLAPGGRLISIDRGAGQEVSRRLLCSGLTDLNQCAVARRLVSSARV